MKLHWSPRSPYVRKVMICIHELGLTERVHCVRTQVVSTEPNRLLMQDNPLSKIPTLVLDDGSPLYDSSVICAYLDALNTVPGAAPILCPREGKARWTSLRWEALGDGILDALIIWRHERNRPAEQQSSTLLAAFALKLEVSLAQLERELAALETAPFCVGHIAIGCALAYLDFRFPDLQWRTGRDALSQWHAQFEARESVRKIPAPHND